MTLRHNAEMIELQRAHLMQKKMLLDRRQAHLNNLQLPGLSVDFNPKEHEDAQKNARTPMGGDPMLFSPFSSGYISPDEAVLNDDNDLSSHNNSVEIMSIIGKLNPHHDGKITHHNDGAGEEFSKSSLILTSGDINQPYIQNQANGGGNVSVNSANSYVIPSLLQAQGFNGTNPPSQMNSKLTPMISPKGGSESNSQLFGSQPKRVVLPDSSQKKGFSPTLGGDVQQQQNQQRRVVTAAYTTQLLNSTPNQQSDTNNKATSPSELNAALAQVQRKASNERGKIKKQVSMDHPASETSENELHLNRPHSEVAKGSGLAPTVLQKQNSMPKGIWIDTSHHHDLHTDKTSGTTAGSTPNPDTADLRSKISPCSNNSLKTISFGSGDFLQDQLRSPLIKTLSTSNENKPADKANEKPQDKTNDNKPSENETVKPNLQSVVNTSSQPSNLTLDVPNRPSPSKKIRTKSPSFSLINRELSITVSENGTKEPILAASNNYTNLVSPKSISVVNTNSLLQAQISPKGEFPIEKTTIKEHFFGLSSLEPKTFLDTPIKPKDQIKEQKMNPLLMEKIRVKDSLCNSL